MLFMQAARWVEAAMKSVRVTQAGQPMDLHRFWDGVITSSRINLIRLRNEVATLRNRQRFQRNQLTELGSTHFKSWAKESFEIATNIASLNGKMRGSPKDGNVDYWTLSRRIRSSTFTIMSRK